MSDTTEIEANDVAAAIEPAPEGVPAHAGHSAPAMLPGEAHAHPTPVQYVIVAVVLVVITALEIATSYLEGDIPNGVIVVLLLVMAAVKFTLVASWYMHQRTDQPVFRRFFVIGTIAAIVLYLVVLLSLHAFLKV